MTLRNVSIFTNQRGGWEGEIVNKGQSNRRRKRRCTAVVPSLEKLRRGANAPVRKLGEADGGYGGEARVAVPHGVGDGRTEGVLRREEDGSFEAQSDRRGRALQLEIARHVALASCSRVESKVTLSSTLSVTSPPPPLFFPLYFIFGGSFEARSQRSERMLKAEIARNVALATRSRVDIKVTLS